MFFRHQNCSSLARLKCHRTMLETNTTKHCRGTVEGRTWSHFHRYYLHWKRSRSNKYNCVNRPTLLKYLAVAQATNRLISAAASLRRPHHLKTNSISEQCRHVLFGGKSLNIVAITTQWVFTFVEPISVEEGASTCRRRGPGAGGRRGRGGAGARVGSEVSARPRRRSARDPPAALPIVTPSWWNRPPVSNITNKASRTINGLLRSFD